MEAPNLFLAPGAI